MLTKKMNRFVVRIGWALMAAVLCAAPAHANGHFPSEPFPREVRDEYLRLCADAGHRALPMSQQAPGAEICDEHPAGCRFTDPESNPTADGVNGCVFAWGRGMYQPSAKRYRFSILFDGYGCHPDKDYDLLGGDEATWDACGAVIPECHPPKRRMLDGHETDNPFAPCVEPEGPPVNEQDRQGRTALHKAVIRDTLSEVAALLARGADPNIADRRGLTALHYAVRARRDADGKVRALLEANSPADPNIRTGRGLTALHWASMGVSAEAVRMLLAAGADPHAKTNRDQTALQLADRRQRTEIAEILREATRR